MQSSTIPIYTLSLIFLVSFCSGDKRASEVSSAQAAKFSEIKVEVLPKGQFMFPINPGKTASLSGTYGDIRFNHFHAGLDIRTGGVEGLPVYAAADGYVSRIGVSSGGYGNALYLTHTNGYTTVYGHLKEYAGKIKAQLLKEQYAIQQWGIDINFDPTRIKVRKGEIVAYSGNTGGSGGPHLHFEIRNAAEETIDPALFGFSEVLDNVQPVVERIVLKPMSAASRINGQFGEVTLSPIRLKNGHYVINSRITATGKIGVQVYTYDRSHTSPFRLGVTAIEMRANGAEMYTFNLSKMAFDTKRDMNLHADYEKMVAGNQKYHKLFVEEGNRMTLYQTNTDGGLLTVENGVTAIDIAIFDTYKNVTNLSFKMVGEGTSPLQVQNATANYAPKLLVNQFGSLLRVQAVGSTYETVPATLQYKGVAKQLMPGYKTANSTVYVYDLRNGVVDFVQVGNSYETLPLNTGATPTENVVKSNAYHINFGEALYHPIFLNVYDAGTVLHLDEDRYPLKSNFDVKWRFQNTNFNAKHAVYLNDKRPKYIGGEWQGNIISFKTKELGTYQLLEDTIPPTIVPRRTNSKDLQFTISDNLSGIDTITCFVNGEWVLMEYEPKLSLIWSEKLDNSRPFTGKLFLKVTDRSGNESTYEKTL